MSGFRLILCTHDLAPEPVAKDDELLCWLPFDDFKRMHDELDALTKKSGVELEITSDDAFASDYELLFPWLVETGRTATFFIPTMFLGRPGRMTVEQVREMRRAGMRIGSHGTNHIAWAESATEVMEQDILTGLRTLEDMLGERITAAAPPFSSYDRNTLRLLHAQGISDIYSCRGGYAVTDGSLRSRVAIASDPAVNASIVELGRRTPGAKDWLRGTLHRIQGAIH